MIAAWVKEGGARVDEQPATWPESFHWWIDAVGSYLVFTKSNIRIGQAGVDGNDIAILGDLSGRHAELVIGSSGVVLLANGATKVNGIEGESFLLKDGDRIRMRSVELTYHRPLPWTQTSRLEVTSGHRLPMSMDGIILLGETCTLGPRREAVVQTNWPASLHLNRYQGRYWVRGPSELTIDGRATDGHGPLRPNSSIEGPWGVFRWEPIGG